MTATSLEAVLATSCAVLATLLVALLVFHLLVIRPWLARATYLTLVRVIEADLARDELDGAVRAQAPAVIWLHGQLTRQRRHPGQLLERREVSEEENGVPTARLVRGYVSELLDAQLDYRTVAGRRIRSAEPQPRHVVATKRAGVRGNGAAGSGARRGAADRAGTGRQAGSRGAAGGRGVTARGAGGRRAAERGGTGRGKAGSGGGYEGAGHAYPVRADSASDHPDRIDLTGRDRGQSGPVPEPEVSLGQAEGPVAHPR